MRRFWTLLAHSGVSGKSERMSAAERTSERTSSLFAAAPFLDTSEPQWLVGPSPDLCPVRSIWRTDEKKEILCKKTCKTLER